MDYQRIWEGVKSEILEQGVPKRSWVWEDYLENFDDFMWQIEHDKECEKYKDEEELIEYISSALCFNYSWSIFEQSGCL